MAVETSRKILVIGGGGREAAMLWKLGRDDPNAELFCAPGNAGIAATQRVICVPIGATDLKALLAFAQEQKIDLTIVGPEAPLVAGIVDLFRKEGLAICGPSRAAAVAGEGSKVLFKEMLAKYAIPTAPFLTFNDPDAALENCIIRGASNIVIKANGLCGGKGVYLPDNEMEAQAVLHELMVDRKYDTAGLLVLIEDRLVGYECSAMAITDGRVLYMFPLTQDHKRAYDGDEGPNTGGMGAYTMALPEELEGKVRRLMDDVVMAFESEGIPYSGFLYLGLMITEQGPMILECNCRLGDPETQVIMPTIDGNLAGMCAAAAAGNLCVAQLPHQAREALCVVLTSPEYPEASLRDLPLVGIESAGAFTTVFHAGTGYDCGVFSTNKSGRILNVVGVGPTLRDAEQTAYRGVSEIEPLTSFRFRRDIGWRALE